MAVLRIINRAKVFTIAECIVLKESQNYEDSVFRNVEYNDEEQINIILVNKCNKGFTVPKTVLFEETSNEGTFRGFIDSVFIDGNEEKEVPLKYKGTIKTLKSSENYTITMNNSTALIELNINNVDVAPISRDVEIDLDNREDKKITKTDLNYYDPDRDAITKYRIVGNVDGLYVDSGFNTPYNSGQEIPIDNSVYFKADDVDEETVKDYNYQVFANGKWSN